MPLGTKIYCEVGQRVISKKKEFQVGDKVRVHVWRDVVVDGEVVIPRGAPIDARVSLLKTNKVAGKKGKLEISADAVRLADGVEIPLSGGYGKQGKSRTALSITLFALVAWPLIFIKGKKAVLEPGTLFDAYTDQQVDVVVRRKGSIRTLDLTGLIISPFQVEILYDELQGTDKVQDLPMKVTVCGAFPETPLLIDQINGEPCQKPLRLRLGEITKEGDCSTALATVDIKELVKQFRKGINRFDVSYGAGENRVASEVILDIQI